jgi:hypothetical protein
MPMSTTSATDDRGLEERKKICQRHPDIPVTSQRDVKNTKESGQDDIGYKLQKNNGTFTS